MSVMSASARTDVSLMEKMNDAMIFFDHAVDNCQDRNYYSAYKEYSKALECFTGDDVDQDPSVNELQTDIKNQMEQIGKLRIFDVRLNFKKNVPQAFDPFCLCSNGRAHDHWCDLCTSGKTVLDLYKWEKAKLEREVSLADLVKVKRRKLAGLLDRVTEMQKQMEVLDEEVKCTMREARYAREELEESRGW